MSSVTGPFRGPTDGPLGRAAITISWFLVLALGQALLLLPGGLAALFLNRDPSNLPLLWACLLPVGPAIAAGLATLRARERDDDGAPVRAFARGLRQNWWDSLRVWALGTGLVTLLAFNAAFGPLVGLPGAYTAFVAVIGVILLAWTLIGLVISTSASFRFRDVLRLGGYYLFSRPLVSLGVIGVVLASALVVVATFDSILVLLAWLATLALQVVTRPLVAHLLDTFVHQDDPDGLGGSRQNP